jgi:hypothetical protein
MKLRCEPAATIIAKLGGVSEVATLATVDVSRVVRWRLPKEQGGTGGLIPMRHIPALLGAARERGLQLEAADFIPVEERAA